jgi:kinesin family protein 11
LHGSYSSLGRDFKNLFEELIKHINSQKAEADDLRRQLTVASEVAMQANAAASARLDAVLTEERRQLAADRQSLLSQISSLITAQGEAQDVRLSSKVSEVQKDIIASKDAFEASRAKYSEGMDAWNDKETKLVGEVLRSRETLKSKLKEDWVVSEIPETLLDFMVDLFQAANKYNTSLQTATKSVHEETIRIVDNQMKDVGIQMQTLDNFVARARSQNAQHHDIHTSSLNGLLTTVRSSYGNISDHFTSTYERVRDLGTEMSEKTGNLAETLSQVDSTLRQPLAELRSNISMTTMQEYIPTGETPQKVQYQYPTELPRTEPHENLLAALRRPKAASFSSSPTKTIPVVFNDTPVQSPTDHGMASACAALQTPSAGGLREIDANVNAGSLTSSAVSVVSISSADVTGKIPLLKRSGSGIRPPQKGLKKPTVIALEGRENSMVPTFSQSTGRRRSPRTG